MDFPGDAAATIVSNGVPSTRYLSEYVGRNLQAFEPVELRERVSSSWERESSAQTPEEVAALLHDQFPFHFADPLDRRIAEFERRTEGAVYSPEVLRHFASQEYGAIEVEERLGAVPQPVLVLAGRHDRTCSVEAAEAISRGVPSGELVVFERSGHMTYVEENEAYLQTVHAFLHRRR